MIRPEKSTNKKIKGARKITFGGMTFDSKLEFNAYQKFAANKLIFQYQKKIIIQPAFEYMGKRIQAITWTCDFWFPEHKILLDTKGYATNEAKIKIKMAKRVFFLSEKEIEILTPRTMNEVIEIIFTKLKKK